MIVRDPEYAAKKQYDLIIIGGGIFGLMLAREASAFGKAVLLVEKEDFGGATSYNSLKIIHGGIRFLQSLDLKQHQIFHKEQGWFLHQFPQLVKPLPVLMPLYQRGLKRKEVFKLAFLADRMLRSFHSIPEHKKTLGPPGKIIPKQEVKKLFPLVPEHGLKGGALWYDAYIPDTQRLIMAVAHQAAEQGATLLNYTQAQGLLINGNTVKGVYVRDTFQDIVHIFKGTEVVLAAGPWNRVFAQKNGCDVPELFQPSVAWNVLFDRPALSSHAVAVTAHLHQNRHYFITPWKGRLFAGTGHAPRVEGTDTPDPTAREMHLFIQGLNAAVPGLNLKEKDILHIFAGFIPVKKKNSLDFVKEDIKINYSTSHRISGLHSVTGTKFTSAHHAAVLLLKSIYPRQENTSSTIRSLPEPGIFDYNWLPETNDEEWLKPLKKIIDDEAVYHLDDLILRRTSLGDNPKRSLFLAKKLSTLLDLNDDQQQLEIKRIENHFKWFSSA